jgi:hypothetical protein
MKHILAWFVLICSITLFAQSPSDYRIVDGHLYNVPKSIMWKEIPPLDKWTYGAGPYDTSHVFYSAKVYSVKSDYILVEIRADSSKPIRNDEWDNRLVLIQHHPKQQTFTKGDNFPQDKFFPISNRTLTNSIGGTETVRCYDYGLLNTLENRKTLKPK